jgi:hypothetical protein
MQIIYFCFVSCGKTKFQTMHYVLTKMFFFDDENNFLQKQKKMVILSRTKKLCFFFNFKIFGK